MRFSYSSGQRPLDGYTLKRGIGRGGFGEVYLAVSDGGKEVALKLVRGNQEIELRGVAQCLNLKHGNLVHLYDLKTDHQGDHWVVMEYVAGEPLSMVLSRHPDGLPRELAREWFLALARGVSYLHDHGIVHRDLKPGNIFLENGTVKVGDYGLSKSISSSQRTAQTQSVGTVHYMAPEISTGNYGKGIDIYAAGIILYEMLTGHVPFDGESAGEILMKHLTATPDLKRLPAEYVPLVSRALAKNPSQRYGSMAEMARAVESLGQERAPGQERPRPPVIPVPPMPRATGAVPVLEEVRPARHPRQPEPILTALPVVTPRGQISELCGSMSLTVLFAALGVPLWATLCQVRDLTKLGSVFFLTILASWAILIPAKFWTDRRGDAWSRRLAMMVLGAVVGLAGLWLDGWGMFTIPASGASVEAPTPGGNAWLGSVLPGTVVTESSYISYYALAFFCLRWWRMTDRRRQQRFSVAPILAAGFWSLLLLLLARPQGWNSVVVLVLAAVIVQVVSPWTQPPPQPVRRMRLRYA
jgi:eukaryotic-like serine/threonine-protein kinase